MTLRDVLGYDKNTVSLKLIFSVTMTLRDVLGYDPLIIRSKEPKILVTMTLRDVLGYDFFLHQLL